MKLSFVLAEALFVVASLAMPYSDEARARNWQQSTTPVARLWIRDKDQQGLFTVLFTVRSGKGATYTVSVPAQSGADMPHDVVCEAVFPNAFKPSAIPDPTDSYTWTATVDGKKVGGGEFVLGVPKVY